MGQQLTIRYPSGIVQQFFGRFVTQGLLTRDRDSFAVVVEPLESTTIGGQVVSPNTMVVIDPRCVVLGQDHQVLYSPREHHKKFSRVLRNWMQCNPQWPSATTLAGEVSS